MTPPQYAGVVWEKGWRRESPHLLWSTYVRKEGALNACLRLRPSVDGVVRRSRPNSLSSEQPGLRMRLISHPPFCQSG